MSVLSAAGSDVWVHVLGQGFVMDQQVELTFVTICLGLPERQYLLLSFVWFSASQALVAHT